MVLVPQVADAVQIPVIAAGGIADGRGVAAVFMLGAKGVQLGTRFVATEEAQVHENYKNCILKARDIDSRVTGQFLPDIRYEPSATDDKDIFTERAGRCCV